jgi:hypothetical protein
MNNSEIRERMIRILSEAERLTGQTRDDSIAAIADSLLALLDERMGEIRTITQNLLTAYFEYKDKGILKDTNTEVLDMLNDVLELATIHVEPEAESCQDFVNPAPPENPCEKCIPPIGACLDCTQRKYKPEAKPAEPSSTILTMENAESKTMTNVEYQLEQIREWLTAHLLNDAVHISQGKPTVAEKVMSERIKWHDPSISQATVSDTSMIYANLETQREIAEQLKRIADSLEAQR